jgi:hypothetical protein
MLNKEMIDAMKCGMFNNKSYFGKKSKELKSGVCKYFRRGVDDKYEWCIIEMMIFGLKNKGLMTNIINRLKILIFEEIVISEVDKIVKLIELICSLDKVEDWNDKIKVILEFVEVSISCKKGRICSYMNNWWKYNSEVYIMDEVVLDKVKEYEKKGDSEELLKLGELLIGFIESRDERIIDIFNKMYKLEDKMGIRYRRRDGVYLYWDIIEKKFSDNEKLLKIIKFGREMFYRKNMNERLYYGIWIGMFVLNYDKLDWKKDLVDEKDLVDDDELEEYFKERKDIGMDKYVIEDFHVNKKYGLDKFAKEGAMVVNEDLSDLRDGEKYRELYIKMKIEDGEKKKKKDGEKKKKKDGEKKKEGEKKKVRRKRKRKECLDLESKLEMIEWVKFENVKVLEDGVCGLKKCCIIVDYEGEKFVLKEFAKSMNWGRDYIFMDGLKKSFGLMDLDMKRIRSDMGLGRIDMGIKSFVKNWKIIKKDSVYCMMKYYENIGDLGKNKGVLYAKGGMPLVEDVDKKKELLKIRLFDGLFRSSDNILRNVLVGVGGELISIDENDIYGKRKKIFNKRGDWCVKNMDKELLDICLKEFEDGRDDRIRIIEDKMKEYGFCKKVEEFKNRYMNYRDIVNSELC